LCIVLISYSIVPIPKAVKPDGPKDNINNNAKNNNQGKTSTDNVSAQQSKKQKTDSSSETENTHKVRCHPLNTCPETFPQGKKRFPCKYGAECYQKKPEHKQKYCHPGDPDYNENNNNNTDSDSSSSKKGNECGRRQGGCFVQLSARFEAGNWTNFNVFFTEKKMKYANPWLENNGSDSDDNKRYIYNIVIGADHSQWRLSKPAKKQEKAKEISHEKSKPVASSNSGGAGKPLEGVVFAVTGMVYWMVGSLKFL
jgi:hypothetical protein